MASEAETLVRESLWRGKADDMMFGLAQLTPTETALLRKELIPQVLPVLKAWLDLEQSKWIRGEPAGVELIEERHKRIPIDRDSRVSRVVTLRLFLVGVAVRKDVEKVLFGAQWRWAYTDGLKGREQFTYRAGNVLAARSETWGKAVLLRLIDPGTDGFAIGSQLSVARELLKRGLFSERELMPVLTRLARLLNYLEFTWDDLDRRILWASLQARDEPLMAQSDYGHKLFDTLLTLVSDGHFSRDALLDLALRRLAEASKTLDANWWVKLLEKMKVSDAEWDARAEIALDLLAAPNPRATPMGLSAAGGLLSRGTLSALDLIPMLGLAINGPSSTAARNAIALLRRCAREPEERLEALRSALPGLQHPKAAVADAVVTWLEKDGWWQDDWEAAAVVADAAITAPPAVAARLQPLLPEQEEVPLLAGHPEVREQGESLPERLRAAAEASPDPSRREFLNRCLNALDPIVPLPDPHPPLVARWRWDAPFVAPSTAEETAELLLRITVAPLTPRDWERMLAGARLPIAANERDTLIRLLDPLIQLPSRMEDPNDRVRPQDGVGTVLRLLECWLGTPEGEAAEARQFQAEWTRPLIRHQLQALRSARQQREVPPPLSLPTAECGWIDPEVFANRLIQYGELSTDELQDLASALYRLPPDYEARRVAWERIRSAKLKLTQPADFMLRVALAAEAEQEKAQAELQNWLTATSGSLNAKLTTLGQSLRRRMARFSKNPGRKVNDFVDTGPAQLQEASPLYSLRLVASAFRCRFGMAEVPALQRLTPVIPGELHPFVVDSAGDNPSLLVRPWPLEPKSVEAQQNLMGQLWRGQQMFGHAASLMPEWGPALAGGGGWYLPADPIAFAFPVVLPPLLAAHVPTGLALWQGGVAPETVKMALRGDCPVDQLIPVLLRDAMSAKPLQGAIVELIHRSLCDGRLSHHWLAEHLGEVLTQIDAKPRALLQMMDVLVRSYPAFRETAATAAELAVARCLNGLTPSARVAILESLLGWRAAMGAGIECTAVRVALEAMAPQGKSGRAVSLAKQLLALGGEGQGDAAKRLRALDLEALAFTTFSR